MKHNIDQNKEEEEEKEEEYEEKQEEAYEEEKEEEYEEGKEEEYEQKEFNQGHHPIAHWLQTANFQSLLVAKVWIVWIGQMSESCSGFQKCLS